MPPKALPTSPVNTGARKRKHILTLGNGAGVDLSTKLLTYNEEVVEAMRLRIIELEDQINSVSEPPAKRRKTANATAVASTTTIAGGPTFNFFGTQAPPPTAPAPVASTSQSKSDSKKIQMQIKKLFDRLKKECKAADVKFQGSPKTVKYDEVLEQSEFDALFKGRGTLIQPTPLNKPTSTVTIIAFSGSQTETFFTEAGTKLGQLKGQRWSIGGAPFFAKSEKLGQCEVQIEGLEVQYSRNTMKCTLKFDVSELGGGCPVYGEPQRARSYLVSSFW